jgi:hypothetical protein
MIRFLVIFLLLALVNAAAVSLLGFEFGKIDYWTRHGALLLVFLAFFPRLALLLSSIPFGGIFWWLGLVFMPRYLVALLSTINYWYTNPILVTFSWVIAIGGETTEKYYISRRVVQRQQYDKGRVIDV